MTSSDFVDPVLNQRLAELRGRFKLALPPKVEAVAATMAQMGAGAMPLAATEELLREVHSLAGASAMFGMDDVNRVAAELEKMILAIRSREHASTEDLGALREACGRLKAAAQACT